MTILPLPPLLRRLCKACLVPKKTPSRFTSITRRHSLRSVSTRGVGGRNAGAIDDNIEGAQVCGHGLEDPLLVAFGSNVQLIGPRQGAGLGGALSAAQGVVGDDHSSPFLSKKHGRSSPNTGGRPGDESYFVDKFSWLHGRPLRLGGGQDLRCAGTFGGDKKPPPYAIFVGSVVLLSLGVPGWSQGLDYASLDWLRGDWVGDHDGAVLEESWSPARGQSMLGFSRMVADGKTVDREFLSLEGTDLRLHLPQADGTMRSLSMQLLEQTPSSFTFIDAGHKEKLEYRLVDAQHLQITLTKGEKTVFRLHRPGLTGANVLGRLFGAYTLTTQIGSGLLPITAMEALSR